jgi:dienelactone hydrolase
MAEVLLFHHAHGLTPGVLELAETLRTAGHTVHTPDLYDGRVFDDLDEGLAHVREVGFPAFAERGRVAAEALPPEVVHAGMSLGVVPAQMLAQTRPGARGALLLSACLPVGEFGSGWPSSVPVQVHGMSGDPFFVDDGDLDAARGLVEAADDAELFLYPGQAHLFADSSLPDFDEQATRVLLERVLGFLDDVGS